jgi:Metallo-peptidase family M12
MRSSRVFFSAVVLASSSFAACGSSSSVGTSDGSDGGTLEKDGSTGDGATPAKSALCTDPPANLAKSKERARDCGLGDEAPLFVRASPYAKVVIEVGSTRSAPPRQAAIDQLTKVMKDLLDKPGGVTVKMDPPIDDIGHSLALADVIAIEDASRTEFAQGDTAVFYYLVVGESSSSDTAQFQVLGYAYRPTSMTVFQKTIDAVSGGLGQPSRDVVESTVVTHEFGHILGLVNTGTAMQTPHEDTAHPKHDANTKCIMYYANNSSELLANFVSGGVVPDFDGPCRADIAAYKR